MSFNNSEEKKLINNNFEILKRKWFDDAMKSTKGIKGQKDVSKRLLSLMDKEGVN